MKFPSNRLLKIQGVVTRELLATLDCYDEKRDPVYIIRKDGNTTDFTVGRYAGLEAYLCDEFGNESIEVAVHNYSKTSGFSPQRATRARSSSLEMVGCSLSSTLACRKASAATSPTVLLRGGPSSNSKAPIRTPTTTSRLSNPANREHNRLSAPLLSFLLVFILTVFHLLLGRWFRRVFLVHSL